MLCSVQRMTSVNEKSRKKKFVSAKPFCEKLAHLKPIHFSIGYRFKPSSHRYELNYTRREPRWSHHQTYIHHMPRTLSKILPKPFRICFFFLYKIVRYFISHNGVPSYQYNGIVQDLFCLCGWLRLFSYDSN